MAPGCAIPVFDEKGDKLFGAGTSFAAPFVSFAAGVLSSLGMEGPLEIRNRIVASTNFRPHLAPFAWSAGTLNIEKAISIFDDSITVRRAAEGEKRLEETLFGTLLAPGGSAIKDSNAMGDALISLCEDNDTQKWLRRTRVVKFSTYSDPATGKLMGRYLVAPLIGTDRKLEKKECRVKASMALAFRVKPTDGQEQERDELFALVDVQDIVPRAVW